MTFTTTTTSNNLTTQAGCFKCGYLICRCGEKMLCHGCNHYKEIAVTTLDGRFCHECSTIFKDRIET